MTDYVGLIVRHLNEKNGCDRLEQTLRILKVQEEAGEVAEAWIGYLGQNPRKGVTHTKNDVADELADVAVTALVAIESLGLDAPARLESKLRSIVARAGLDSPAVSL